MIYLASPYTAPTPEGQEENYQKILKVTGKLLAKGMNAWSPIVHCHEVAKNEKLPTDFAFWINYNHDFIRRADAVYIACIPGWERSKGVAEEIAFAKTLNILVAYVHEETGNVTRFPFGTKEHKENVESLDDCTYT